MLHMMRVFLRYGPGGIEEKYALYFRLLLLIPLADLLLKLQELHEKRAEFPHRPELWLSAADCLHVTLELVLFAALLLHLTLRRIGHPLPASRFMKITSLPDPAQPDPAWRYSRVDAASVRDDNLGSDANGLEPYAAISESFTTITGAHPDLAPKPRRKLYLKWYRLNPSAFLSLEHRNWYGGWSVVAISIILPLTPTGLEAFVEGLVSIKTLRRIDVEPLGEVPSALLVDTLIISKRFHRWTENFAFPGLLMRHVAEFWPEMPSAWSVLVEPDDRKVESKLLVGVLGFRKVEAREDDSPLYVLGSDALDDERVARNITPLGANLVKVRAWPLHVAGAGASPPT